MKDTQAINSIAGKIENLPTLPGIAIKLLQAVQKNEPNISEIGEILSKDVALTAKILKLVNSSFYSLSSRITTVDHAIKLLVAERLREKIKSQNIAYKDKTISLTMSFGVACMPSNQNLSSDSLIKMADDALYKAKAQGRNRCCMLDRGGNECS